MYTGFIVAIKDVRKHSNADRLNVGMCFGNQVIVSLETENGQVGVYFPSDGQLGVEYCEVNNLVRKKDVNGKEIGGYLDPDKRNIRALKLRGEVSDGLFMPLESLATFTDISKLKVGELITVLNKVEICKKYVPVVVRSEVLTKKQSHKGKKKLLKESFPMFHEHVDTKQLMYNLNSFKENMVCYVTLKMHGTSGRTSYTNKKTVKQGNVVLRFIGKLLKKEMKTTTSKWQYISGTRRVVLENMDSTSGYHKDPSMRVNAHDLFVGKLKKGETVFYEIVGFENSGRPIMGTVDNKKTNDKQFIKKYGKTTTYSYGCEVGQNDVYIYRMSIDNEDGDTVDYPWDLVQLRAEQIGVKTVPELDRFIYTTQEDMLGRVEEHVDGEDPIGLTHIREGVVVRIEGADSFKVYKHKGFTFKLLEGIIKDSGFLDVEEEESLKGDEEIV